MRNIFYRLGLIKKIEYTFNISRDSLIERLINESMDNYVLGIERVFGFSNPLKSKDFIMDNQYFRIEKKYNMNPFSGRGVINGEIITINSNTTKLRGEIVSNYKELKNLIFIPIFIAVLWTPFFYFGEIGFEWILIGIAFTFYLVIQTIFYLKFDIRKLKRDFEKFIKRVEK